MIFHENCLPAHVISYLILCQKLGKVSQYLSSAAAVIGALSDNPPAFAKIFYAISFNSLHAG